MVVLVIKIIVVVIAAVCLVALGFVVGYVRATEHGARELIRARREWAASMCPDRVEAPGAGGRIGRGDRINGRWRSWGDYNKWGDEELASPTLTRPLRLRLSRI